MTDAGKAVSRMRTGSVLAGSAVTSHRGRLRVVGEADHVAPRVGDLDDVAGTQPARRFERLTAPLAQQGLGSVGVGNLEPQSR